MLETVVLERRGRLPAAVALIVVALAMAAFAIVPAAASAKGSPAGLDKSFGKNGRAAVGFGFDNSRPEYATAASSENSTVDLISSPGGSTVVAGKYQIARFLPNGQLDAGFGQGGRLTPATLDGLSFEVADVAFDSQGRLLVFGTGEDMGTTKNLNIRFAGGMPVHPSYLVVARYTASGALDPAFSGGDGVARFDFDTRVDVPVFGGGDPPPLVRGVAGTVDGQDRPVVLAGTRNEWRSEISTQREVRETVQLVARLTPNGDLEAGFGGRGVAPVLPVRLDPGVAVTSSESIVVSGIPTEGASLAELPTGPYTAITVFNPDGTLDGAYGTSGTQIVVGGGDVALDPKGRLLVLQRPQEKGGHQQALRLLANGQVDKTFGRSGRVGLQPPNGGAVSSLAVDAKGRVLVTGVAGRQQSSKPGGYPSGRRLIVGRLLASGLRDRRFGKEGWLQTGMGKQTRLGFPGTKVGSVGEVPSAALDSRGRLVVADPGTSPKLPDGGVFLARYKLGS